MTPKKIVLGLVAGIALGCAGEEAGAGSQATCVAGLEASDTLASAVCEGLMGEGLVSTCDGSRLVVPSEGCLGKDHADPPIDVQALVAQLTFIPDDAIPGNPSSGTVSWDEEGEDPTPSIEVDLDNGEFYVFGGGPPLCADPMSGQQEPCGPPMGNGPVDDPLVDMERYLPHLGIALDQAVITTSPTGWGPGMDGVTILLEREINGALVGNYASFSYSDDTGLVSINGHWNPIDYAKSDLGLEGSVQEAVDSVVTGVAELGSPVDYLELWYDLDPWEVEVGQRARLDLQLWVFYYDTALEVDI